MAYSFDGMGLGHLRRNLTIIGALRQQLPHAAVLTVTGSPALDRFALPEGVDVLRLPGMVKTRLGTSRAARLPLPTADVRELRAELLAAAVRAYRPDLLLVDFYPLGREGELAPALREARAVGTRLVLGLRDILDGPEAVAQEWQETGQFVAAAATYDSVLVYGDPSLYDVRTEYSFPAALSAKTCFTGYLAGPAAQGGPGEHAEIVCTMGGGSDAAELAHDFVEAVRPLVAAGRTAALVTGPFMPAVDVERLQAAAPDGLLVRTFVPDAPRWFAQASCVVSMAGYNTTCELLAAGVPTVFVPRARPRLEQRLRATRISALTGWHVLMPEDLRPQGLRTLIEDALTMPRGTRDLVLRDGVGTAGRLLAAHLRRDGQVAL